MAQQHKTFHGAMELKQDGQPGDFSARFATLNVLDRDKDVTLPGAFGKQSVIIEQYGHNDQVLPVGSGEIGEQGNDALVNGRFFLDTTAGKEHYTTLKNLGPLQQWSYTFEVQDSAPGVFEGQDVRFLKKMHVIAVAPVQRGAGINTQTLDMKGKAVMRTEPDGDHPASHYLVVEDPQTVTTWHLRVRDAAGNLDHRLMGGAWAALHAGYRGNVYTGPGKAEAIAKLTRLYADEGLDVPKANWDGEHKAGARHSSKDSEMLQKMHDLAVELGAKCAGHDDNAGDGQDQGQDKDPKGKSRSPESRTLAARVALELLENQEE